MSYIDHNPRVAWAMAFESGIRSQAAAGLEEVGAKVQTSGIQVGGSCYGDHYIPIYSTIRRMEREQPVIAAVGHWLCLADTGEANQYLDDVADTVLTRYIVATPEWSSFRKARKARIEALVKARMVMDRNDMDGNRPLWQPLQVCEFVSDWLGVTIVSYNWQRDGWEQVWIALGGIIAKLEDEAMAPIARVAREVNKALRDSLKDAA